MKDTKQIGDVSTAMVMAALLRKRQNILIPFGDRQRYDLVIESGGSFMTVQCKTVRFDGEYVVFNLYSVVR